MTSSGQPPETTALLRGLAAPRGGLAATFAELGRRGDVVPAACALLRSDDARERAAALLGARMVAGAAAVPLAVDALGDGSAQVRLQAVLALARPDARDAWSLVTRALDDPDPEVRRQAPLALAAIDAAAAEETLRARLAGTDRADRLAALAGLEAVALTRHAEALAADRHGERAIEPATADALVAALADDDDELRARLATLLVRHAAAAARPAFRRLVSDPVPAIRALGIEGLAGRDPSGAVTAAVELVDDPSVLVRLAALRALGRLGDASVRARLLAVLAGDEDPVVRAAIIDAVAALPGAVPPALTAELGHGSARVRAAAVRACPATDPAWARLLLEILAGDPSPSVRSEAAASLAARLGADVANTSTADIVGALQIALDDPEPGVQRAAALGLGRAPTAAARVALEDRARRPASREVCAALALALAQRDSARFGSSVISGDGRALFDPDRSGRSSTTWIADPSRYPRSEYLTFHADGWAEADDDGDKRVLRYRVAGDDLELDDADGSVVARAPYRLGRVVERDAALGARLRHGLHATSVFHPDEGEATWYGPLLDEPRG